MATKPLFIIGNKRSGTTVLTEFLNQHDQIYMGHEVDVLWKLFSYHEAPTPTDHARNREHILAVKDWYPAELFRGYLTGVRPPVWTGSPREDFFNWLKDVKDEGQNGKQYAFKGKSSDALKWVGDKKPAVTTDPVMRPWIEEHFPDASYIHITRNPRYSIASMAGLDWPGGVEGIAKLWVELENRANELESLHVRYEDLMAAPDATFATICDYLELDMALKQPMNFKLWESKRANQYRRGVKDVPLTPEIHEYMERYGYE